MKITQNHDNNKVPKPKNTSQIFMYYVLDLLPASVHMEGLEEKKAKYIFLELLGFQIPLSLVEIMFVTNRSA